MKEQLNNSLLYELLQTSIESKQVHPEMLNLVGLL